MVCGGTAVAFVPWPFFPSSVAARILALLGGYAIAACTVRGRFVFLTDTVDAETREQGNDMSSTFIADLGCCNCASELLRLLSTAVRFCNPELN